MARITQELNTIYNYWLGEEIRFPIRDALYKINEQIELQNAGIDPTENETNAEEGGGDEDA